MHGFALSQQGRAALHAACSWRTLLLPLCAACAGSAHVLERLLAAGCVINVHALREAKPGELRQMRINIENSGSTAPSKSISDCWRWFAIRCARGTLQAWVLLACLGGDGSGMPAVSALLIKPAAALLTMSAPGDWEHIWRTGLYAKPEDMLYPELGLNMLNAAQAQVRPAVKGAPCGRAIGQLCGSAAPH